VTEEIRAGVGEEFEVSLQATPTAGFTWEVSIPTEGADVINFLGSEWQAPVPSELGGSPSQRFRFRAIGPGRVSLLFRYRRRWENSDLKRRVMVVSIDSQPTVLQK